MTITPTDTRVALALPSMNAPARRLAVGQDDAIIRANVDQGVGKQRVALGE